MSKQSRDPIRSGLTGVGILLAGCANTPLGAGHSTSLAPGSSITDNNLLAEAYSSLKNKTSGSMSCASPNVISAAKNAKQTDGALTETWKINVCGTERSYTMIFVPNGMGGYMIAIGE